MNVYRYQFVSICPANDKPVLYSLTIETDSTVMVETIIEAAMLHESAFHEEIADDLFERFGGKQTMTANHHGVEIETIRSAA